MFWESCRSSRHCVCVVVTILMRQSERPATMITTSATSHHATIEPEDALHFSPQASESEEAQVAGR